MSSTAAAEDLVTVIGLEVHVQLETDTKIFCGCSTDAAGAEPNSLTCPVCLGLPGSLPVVNEAAVEAAVKVGQALDAEIASETRFHRKNYYYPDLPKNFQISQYDAPICRDGRLAVDVDGDRREVSIRRAHLEEDPGSITHAGGTVDTADHTLIDYNRAGTPLLEIVTDPDFRSPAGVRAFLAKLEEVLEYLDVYDAGRDGSLRVDANVSLVDADAADGGTIAQDTLDDANRTEIKNISSHRGAEQAIAYETSRQRDARARGQSVQQETRHWDESRGVTVTLREKEAEKDYRYYGEADLPPLRVADWRDRIDIPELPDARRERFRDEYGLDAEAAAKLTSTKAVADFYEAVADRFDPAVAASWVADELLGELNYRNLSIGAMTDRRGEFCRLIELVEGGDITRKNGAEVVLRAMLDDGVDPDTVVEREGLGAADDDAVAAAVEAAIEENPDAVEDYHAGETEALNHLVGDVMAATNGGADPATVNELLRERLE